VPVDTADRCEQSAFLRVVDGDYTSGRWARQSTELESFGEEPEIRRHGPHAVSQPTSRLVGRQRLGASVAAPDSGVLFGSDWERGSMWHHWPEEDRR